MKKKIQKVPFLFFYAILQNKKNSEPQHLRTSATQKEKTAFFKKEKDGDLQLIYNPETTKYNRY